MLIAHISDLHVGKIKEKRLIELRNSLKTNKIDRVLITGDVTDSGRTKQWNRFLSIFADIIDYSTIVPGNHDRIGDDIAELIMDQRIQTHADENIYVIKVDTTGPHNKVLVLCHGIVGYKVLRRMKEIINEAPKNKFVIVMFHHHPIKLPEDTWYERLASYVRWKSLTMELKLGQRVIDSSLGKVDAILHGHRHTPSSMLLPSDDRPLAIYNAGCTPALKRYRTFEIKKGKLVGYPTWVNF